jgi:methylenetetrahydrofolate/methylenetetrahydromethanopterin dehydrogenase (NADP+)
MSEKATILVQLDTDPLSSVFDRVVAVDTGVSHVFSYGGVNPTNVMPLVHGCVFTRSPKDLNRTALFIGGSDMAAGELVLAEVRKHMLPAYGLSVSVMLDSNGANTTAVAAVRCAGKHIELDGARCLVLGGTGPVGQRVARLLAKAGAKVRLGSRQKDRADGVVRAIREAVPGADIEAVVTALAADAPKALDRQEVVVAAGGPGVVLLPKKVREACKSLQVAIDLNGVPPAGIEGVNLGDKAVERDGVVFYGALGVGGLKMKIHKASIIELFDKHDRVLDVDEIYDVALKHNLQ